MIDIYLGLSWLLAIDVYHFDLVGIRGKSYIFAQIRRWSCARFLLQAFKVGRKLNVVDPNFTGRGEFNKAWTGVGPEGIGGRRIKNG
jgi:hypothetical protein